jgi:hypothetical protein
MLSVKRTWLLASLLGSVGCGVAYEDEALGERQQAQVSCIQECPPGTRIATFAVEEQRFAYDTFGGAFFYQKDRCETYCEPETTCEPPNVPTISDDGFSCQLLPRYATFPSVDEVDLSFGALWDETAVMP